MSLKNNSDNWLANVMTYVRAMNGEDEIKSQFVKKIRKLTESRQDYWTIAELTKHK